MKGLIVEDDAIIRLVLMKFFTKQGYTLFEAKNGMEGLEVFVKNKETLDFIITDIMMPEMDGMQMAKAIRNSQSINKPLIIAITAADQEYYAPEPDLFDKIFGKPVPMKQLNAEIRNFGKIKGILLP